MAVRYEVDGAVVTVTIDRPHVRNAVDPETAAELFAAFERFDKDPALNVGVLTGAGGTFCAGFDLKALAAGRAPLVEEGGRGPMGPTRMELDKPVIAAIEGYAVAGGLELALWCDLRVAGADATLGVFNRRFGVPLIDLGTVRLPRMIGQGRALDLILTGRIVEAEEASAMGLVTEVVEPGRHLERALEYAEALAAFPQQTMLADRRAAIEGFGLPLAEGIALEAESALPTLEVALRGAGRFAAGEGRGGAGAGV